MMSGHCDFPDVSRERAVRGFRNCLMKQGIDSMSSVVDFLEKIGSEAQWRDASADQIEQALVEADIEVQVRSAILTHDISELRALLGQVKLMGVQIPGPSPEEIPEEPEQPDPEKKEEEDEEEQQMHATGAKHSKDACYSVPASSLSLL
jgi:hypothetical protein